VLGDDFLLLPDFWIWNVDPQKGEAGWKPHRDKGWISLFEDGTPKSLSLWLPLTEATPLNGCMYLVPRSQDPTYGTPDEKDWQFQYAGIRALPAGPGDFLLWTQAILHWGARTSPRAPESRISISFEVQRADVPAYNYPLLNPAEIPPFDMRLRLLAKQILQYRHMYPLDLGMGLLASGLLWHGYA
jgi:ectoine hydroxylase-related dioxygenase (phytanoyl-CoA dioxygenase family)